MSNHTPEPWTYSDDGLGFSIHHVHDDSKGRVIARTRERFPDDEADAKRIVACVNACAPLGADPAKAISAMEKALRGVIAQCGGDDDAFPEVRAALALIRP